MAALKSLSLPLLFGVLMWSPQPALAQANLGVALRAGTAGVGGDLSLLFASHAAIRVSGSFFSFERNATASDIDYDAKVTLHSVTGLLDLYPSARGSFRFSAGVATNPAAVTATGRPSGSTFTINGTTYPSSVVGTLTGTVKFPSAAPYVGIGFGTPAHRGKAGVFFLFDLGAIIAQPTVSLVSSGANVNPVLAANLQAQADTTQQQIDKYVKVYPVLSLGLGFRF